MNNNIFGKILAGRLDVTIINPISVLQVTAPDQGSDFQKSRQGQQYSQPDERLPVN